MMRVVPLATIPNQSLTIQLDGARWSLALKEARGVMCADISLDGTDLLRGVRIVAGEPLIPYRYLQNGNFLFLTNNNEIPDWGSFNASQTLVYLSAEEISLGPTVTVGDILAAQDRVGYLTDNSGFYLTTDAGELLTDD